MRIAVILLAVASPVCEASARDAAPASPPAAHPYAHHVAEASLRFGIPQEWIWRVMQVESRGKPRALSPVGAMGLMQIMPATWAMLTARHGLGADPFDVRANILAGAAYLRAMWDRYRDVRLMLAAYNAGPGRADAFASGRRGLPAETRAYVAQIAPALGAAGVAPLAHAPAAEVPNWRSASVFAASTDRSGAGSGLPPQAPASGSSAAPSPAGPSPAAAIFVPLSGRVQ